MRKFFVFLIFSMYSACVFAQAFSIGQFSIGKAAVDLDVDDFNIEKAHSDIEAGFIGDSIQWLRPENNLLTPRVLLNIRVPKKYQPVYFKIADHVIFPSNNGLDLSSQVYINLFNPETIQIFQGDKVLDTIQISTKAVAKSKLKQWIDYTCLPYNIVITGIEQQYTSTGCKLNRIGSFGKETPRLEVAFSSPNLTTLAGDHSPFLFNLTDNSPVETVLINKTTKEKVNVTVAAKLPARLNRLKMAGGLGPYFFTNTYKKETKGPDTAPSYMLYGKYEISETSSLKAFDALVYNNKSLFNNSGLYFSYDLAQVLDGQVILGALIGFQGLNYRYDTGYPNKFEMIYPQGFELTYNHPFGVQNYYLSYGMFLSTTQELYRNMWLRFGNQVFYELNYITWGNDIAEIDMWGLSVGFPLFKAF
ncbi:hypothetical protein CIK05_09820 [Bdellovibrio sp. qaytius]|nr:hypothetical protein CIK05_09820 [Bdellovibrio sp. qaytius]